MLNALFRLEQHGGDVAPTVSGAAGELLQRGARRLALQHRAEQLSRVQRGGEPAGAEQKLIARKQRPLYGEGRDRVQSKLRATVRRGRGRLGAASALSRVSR